MITNNILAGSSLFFGALGCVLLIVSLVVYIFKRQDYTNLVSSYQERYKLPAPCTFYYMTGFFGAFPVIRFFIKLSKKKKMSYINLNDPAYSFFDDEKMKIRKWMRLYSFLWFTATACYVLFAIFGLLLP